MYNFERVLNRLSWLCLFLFFSRVLLLGGRDRREGGWMSKGEERRVLRNREEKFGWSGESLLSLLHLFPHHSISLSSLKLWLPILLLIWSLHFIWRQMESFSTTWRWGRLWSINNNGSYSPKDAYAQICAWEQIIEWSAIWCYWDNK